MPCSMLASSILWKDAIGQPTQLILKSRNTRIEAGQRVMTCSTVISKVGALVFILPV